MELPFIILIVALVVVIVVFVGSLELFYGVPFVPTPMATVKWSIELAEFKPSETLYDLGSGDGRVIISAAREFGGRAVGIEHNRFLARNVRKTIGKMGLHDRVEVVRGDFFAVDLRKADVVFMYLPQEVNAKLRPKLESELKPRARVVAYKYEVAGWKPAKVDRSNRIYVYQMHVTPEKIVEVKKGEVLDAEDEAPQYILRW